MNNNSNRIQISTHAQPDALCSADRGSRIEVFRGAEAPGREGRGKGRGDRPPSSGDISGDGARGRPFLLHSPTLGAELKEGGPRRRKRLPPISWRDLLPPPLMRGGALGHRKPRRCSEPSGLLGPRPKGGNPQSQVMPLAAAAAASLCSAMTATCDNRKKTEAGVEAVAG